MGAINLVLGGGRNYISHDQVGAINLVLGVGGWGEGRNDISHVRGGAINLVLRGGEDISHQGYKYCPWRGGGRII